MTNSQVKISGLIITFNEEKNIKEVLDCFDFCDEIIIVDSYSTDKTAEIALGFPDVKFIQNKFGKIAEPKYSIAQMLSADCIGLSHYYEIHHRPHILNRSMLKNFFDHNSQLLNKQISFKFRNIDQLLPVGLSNHLAIQSNQAVLKADVEIAYLKDDRNLEQFISDLANDEIKFGCIQSLDQLEKNAEQKLSFALTEKFKDVLPSQIKANHQAQDVI